jgi:hypothetical protein
VSNAETTSEFIDLALSNAEKAKKKCGILIRHLSDLIFLLNQRKREDGSDTLTATDTYILSVSGRVKEALDDLINLHRQ